MNTTKKFFLTNLSICLLAFCAMAQNNPSIIKEYKKSFTTYGFTDPDPIAKMGIIYPYFRFDGYTNKGVAKDWKVVELENDFIKLIVLPEIGGKIWGAWEKSTGKPFIYYNHVVKFRDVAMRGPWTSGGIEANYGIIGHTPNCATPVDYYTEQKEDGSVSCFIGTLDLLTQTYWTVEINLPKDKGYFTTRSFWNNSTSLEQPYYTWMNTGLKAAGNLEFIYPGTKYIGHAGEYADWKMNKENGKDISFYEQNNFGGYKSYHVFGKYSDFFGAYWHRDDFGMARYSTHDEKAGKKIWIWGLSPQGMIWEKLLSDTDGQYVEVQSGRMYNQAARESTFTPFKHMGFPPSSADTWTEYWFPVKATQGFVKANPFGALNVKQENGYLKIFFSPLQDLGDELVVTEGNQMIYAKKLEMKTLKVFSDSIAFHGNANNLTVKLGKNDLVYHSDPDDGVINRPVDSPSNFDWNSVYGLYIQGKEYIQQRFYSLAEEKFAQCLNKDPNYLPALVEMSVLMYRNLQYAKALGYARHALSINTYDPAANFYYGVINLQFGNVTDAKDGFDIAALSGEYRAAAFTALSKIYFTQGEFDKSLLYADKSIEVNTSNLDAYQTKVLIARIKGEKDKAMTNLAILKKLNPLNHFIRFEEFLMDSTTANQNNFTSLIQNELGEETYLQLADWYYSLGLLDESQKLLNLAPANAEIYYWIAFLEHKRKGNNVELLLEKASGLSPRLVFPFRSSSVDVLTWAISQSSDWKPKYYLALVYWSRNNTGRAKELFEQCGNPEFAPFYASRASLLGNEQYATDLRKAAQLDPQEWRYGKLLVIHFMDIKNYTEALTTAREYHNRFPHDFRISMLLAKAFLMNKEYKATSDLLNQTTILPYEGATDGRQLYREAWLMQAVHHIQKQNYNAALKEVSTSRVWPERLGVGKPYGEDIDDRLENYIEAICFERLRNNDKARSKLAQIVSYNNPSKNVKLLLTALALRKLSKEAEGEYLLVEWVKTQPENQLAKWSLDMFQRNVSEVNIDAESNDNLRMTKELMLLE